mmetsp:Transcript_3469/g.8163  ORF Transcript_3469/g.8163 Transcript_3469/m.8163 type:complete len:212 (-) Transcript_3469:890-1525(-)
MREARPPRNPGGELLRAFTSSVGRTDADAERERAPPRSFGPDSDSRTLWLRVLVPSAPKKETPLHDSPTTNNFSGGSRFFVMLRCLADHFSFARSCRALRSRQERERGADAARSTCSSTRLFCTWRCRDADRTPSRLPPPFFFCSASISVSVVEEMDDDDEGDDTGDDEVSGALGEIEPVQDGLLLLRLREDDVGHQSCTIGFSISTSQHR